MSAIRDSVKIDSVLLKILKVQGWRRPKNLGDYLYRTRMPQVAADRPVRSRSRPLGIVTSAGSKGSTEHVIRELNQIKQEKITFIYDRSMILGLQESLRGHLRTSFDLQRFLLPPDDLLIREYMKITASTYILNSRQEDWSGDLTNYKKLFEMGQMRLVNSILRDPRFWKNDKCQDRQYCRSEISTTSSIAEGDRGNLGAGTESIFSLHYRRRQRKPHVLFEAVRKQDIDDILMDNLTRLGSRSGTWDDQWSIEISGDGQSTKVTGYLEPDPQIVENVRLLHQQLWLKMWLNQCDYYILYNFSSILIYHLTSPTQIRMSYVVPASGVRSSGYPSLIECMLALAFQRLKPSLFKSSKKLHVPFSSPQRESVAPTELWSILPKEGQSPVTPSAAPRTSPKDRATSIGIAFQKMGSILEQDRKRLDLPRQLHPDLWTLRHPFSRTRLKICSPCVQSISQIPLLVTSPEQSSSRRALNPSRSESSILMIGEPISWGRTWDVYLGVLAIPLRLTQNTDDLECMLGAKDLYKGSVDPYVILRVVAKITPPNLPECLRLVDKRSQIDAMKAARKEAKIYNTRLKNLQGDKVPECHGLWKVKSGPDKRLIMVLSRVEGRLEGEDENWGNLHDLDRFEIAKLYQAIHSVGVVHGDRSLRHIRYDYNYPSTDPYRDPSPLMLIDFEGSKIVGKRHPDLLEEKSIVLSKLDLAEDYY
ncbi:hypothetical protein V866_005025 [Kwoniella sp. B9012]